jgi:hypothetical protein
MLSGRLRRNLKDIPIPSLHGHIDDLFDYFSEVLTDAFKLPFVEDIDELKLLTSELRKGVRTLLEPTASSRPYIVTSSEHSSSSLSTVH